MAPRLALITAIAALYALAMSPTPGVAADDVFEVVGVAANDVLNVRTEPNAKAAIVATLAPGTAGIKVEQRRGAWAFIRVGDKSGWVNRRFLQDVAHLADPKLLVCTGTEPFWSLTLDGTMALFERAGQPRISNAIGEVRQSQSDTTISAWRPTGGPIVQAIVSERQCDDGMSDTKYPTSVIVDLRNGELLTGCCRPER